ncbi:MAG: ABC transporter substrate-binding protein [Rhodocyclaceae bacterium]|nr:ABC transporter substrate-binding protein [Rhodocyclaceae bacterium]
MPGRLPLFVAILLAVWLAGGCGRVWNDPYPGEKASAPVLYSAFVNRPKHLDPVQSYSENEATFTYQIYEPPLQYHYLKRPYVLEPGAAASMPEVRRFDAAGRELPEDAAPDTIATTEYTIHIRPGMRYQPHPAFAEQPRMPADPRRIGDFLQMGSREVVADDFVYQIKRLAHPRLHSPILELIAGYLPGLRTLHQQLLDARLPPEAWLDLRPYALEGVELIDRYTYRIRLQGTYPQFLYWLAMPFFAPVPFEAERFYSAPGLAERNFSLDWWPVGSGPYMLVENDPNSRMVLARNPNYREDRYPCEGDPEDREAGLLADCGKPMPFIEQVVFAREKESIPYWNKFLQGYYDASGISSDNFDQAVQSVGDGDVRITPDMAAKGIRLVTSVAPTVMYMGFNMLDPVVGGDGEAARKLRQAISIAIDQEEFISIFQNGRGVPAMHPLPPGLFGFRSGEAGINPYVYDWKDGRAVRKPASEARRLLAEAGYPDGRDAHTGAPLVIYLDTTGTGMGGKAEIDWLTKQFKKIDVQLVVRATDYNRFQDKIRKGNAQLFYWGWNADYPDPENFLFLLHGAQGKVASQGENAANYRNAEFDALFERMKAMPDSPERQQIIDRMIAILQHDAPWNWGFYEVVYSLQHDWIQNRKPGKIVRNTLKYQNIDGARRAARRAEWNQPVLWPLGLGLVLLLALVWPAVAHYRRRERATGLAVEAR